MSIFKHYGFEKKKKKKICALQRLMKYFLFCTVNVNVFTYVCALFAFIFLKDKFHNQFK